MNKTIYLKPVLAATLCVGLSHAMEQREEKMQPSQITSVERVEGNNTPSLQKKASLMVDLWMCINKNDFHRRFKGEFMKDILSDEVKVAIHQIDRDVTDERMLQLLKDVAGGDFSPRVPGDGASMVKYERVDRWAKIKNYLEI